MWIKKLKFVLLFDGKSRRQYLPLLWRGQSKVILTLFLWHPATVKTFPRSGQLYHLWTQKECLKSEIRQSEYEPPHDKTNKMTVCPAKTQIRPGWSKSSLCAHWVAKDPSFLHVDSEDWSDWADAQADLSLHWVHSHFVSFVMRRLI